VNKGWALDKNIRDNGSSGGAVTAVLCGLLENESINAAILTGNIPFTCGEYEPVIAQSTDEIKSSSQSKYQIIPVNMILSSIKEYPGKFAYVGLPCQIHGLRKAMMQNSLLNEKIAYIIGIFCGFNLYRDATDFLIKKSGIARNEIKSLEYRGKHLDNTGFKLESLSGQVFFVPKHDYTILNFFYCSKRCMKCYDLTAEFSDISFGDAWEENRCSRIIVRTDAGEHILKTVDGSYLHVEKSSENDILNTQRQLVSHKKKNIFQRKEMSRFFPEYSINFPKLGLWKRFSSAFFYVLFFLCSSWLGLSVIRILPIKLLSYISRTLRRTLVEKETIFKYLIFGALTIAFNFMTFISMNIFMDYWIANMVSIVATKFFAFYTNKTFVFKSKSPDLLSLVKEFLRFVVARGFTGLVDFFGLFFMVSFLMMNENVSKIILII